MARHTPRQQRLVTRSRIHELSQVAHLRDDCKAAVSLHAHSHHSREAMGDLPRYIARIPIVSKVFERQVAAYARREGVAIDFSRGWWHPPVSPRALFESESTQIERVFGLLPLVSVTDHDCIGAGLELQSIYANRCAPVSFEWTVPWGEGYFHLGVHNLPAAAARDWFGRLNSVTERTSPEPLSEVFAALNAHPGILVVLNHPIWDLAGVGEGRHAALLREFMAKHRDAVHAVELNGYRSWKENRDAAAFGVAAALPLISGGDRHGCAPNALLNLTRATTFADFAREVREGISDVVIMPEYREHIVARKLTSAADILRWNPAYPGRHHWTDRVTYESGGVIRPLSRQWPDGGPLWVRSSVGAFRIVTSGAMMPVVRFALQAAEPSSNAGLAAARLLGAQSAH